MNKVKFQFSIKDLENLSGIKAHTIRIWEKRYQIFTPERTETNIRFYTLEELQKLLNVSFLNNYGYKISRVAELSEVELNKLVKQVYSEKTNTVFAINVLKIAMINFDTALFNETHLELSKTKSFDQIFLEIYMPFLSEIGMLWQTSSIKPIHEHFISYLILQKLIENTCAIQNSTQIVDVDKLFVLFLPENEVHEMSLLFTNYQLVKKGYKTIYLGTSVPFTDLLEINKFYNNVNFISHFTVMPYVDEIEAYVKRFEKEILNANSSKLYVSGNQTKHISTNNTTIFRFNLPSDLTNTF
ncbi:MerR family transcriptional regulator [Flavobacterium sp. SUN046]|uniref:MerR family transcriptional regulator n=1 Tax=Flavobacterium sp. SUN046 TaxID=3002440 RepID=UPI002DBE5AE8|nr:MerR family transcriptional regulator [Flavobacterium sp. SUN046]MEC4050826.1 MerR family transcriptional regulator [Flavobacterium sp. SUN046]